MLRRDGEAAFVHHEEPGGFTRGVSSDSPKALICKGTVFPASCQSPVLLVMLRVQLPSWLLHNPSTELESTCTSVSCLEQGDWLTFMAVYLLIYFHIIEASKGVKDADFFLKVSGFVS